MSSQTQPPGIHTSCPCGDGENKLLIIHLHSLLSPINHPTQAYTSPHVIRRGTMAASLGTKRGRHNHVNSTCPQYIACTHTSHHHSPLPFTLTGFASTKGVHTEADACGKIRSKRGRWKGGGGGKTSILHKNTDAVRRSPQCTLALEQEQQTKQNER